MAKRKIVIDDGLAALAQLRDDPRLREAKTAVGNPVLATAARFLLEDLAQRMPGNSVEVRVPLFGAVQCVPGPDHRRGTPPNVAEMDVQTWLALALGETTVDAALESGKLVASGTRALAFADVLPLVKTTA